MLTNKCVIQYSLCFFALLVKLSIKDFDATVQARA